MEHQDAVRTLAAERYLLREMTDDEQEAFEAHYFECPICAESVRVGAALGDAASMGAAGTAKATVAAPLPFRRRSLSFGSLAPLAAAATLALVAGYQTFVTIPELRSRADAAHTVIPVAVAPTSRGAVAEVPLDRTTSAWLALQLDINVDTPSGTELDYDLRTDAGGLVLSGYIRVPPQGESPTLLLPGNILTAGQYAIVVRDGSDQNREIGTYRFAVR
jgi:hypothetical protein